MTQSKWGGQVVTIQSIDYANNKLTVNRSISFASGAGVSFPYSGSMPDIGAEEVASSSVAPVANAQSDLSSGEAPLTVSFDGSGSSDSDGSIVSYQWSFGDGSTGSGMRVGHTFYDAGTYNVVLTVTDDSGLSHSDSLSIQVNSTSSGDTGGDLVDGTPVIDYNADRGLFVWRDSSGRYNVEGTGGGVNVGITYVGRIISDKPLIINEKVLMEADDIASLSTDGKTLSFQLKAWGSGTDKFIFSAAFDAGAELYLDDLPASTVKLGANKTSASSLPVILQEAAAVNLAPVAMAASDVSSGDAPLTVVFNGLGSYDPDGSIASYQWNFGDGGSSTSSTPSHVFQSAGSYTVTLTVTDNSGASDSDSLTINVTALSVSFQAMVSQQSDRSSAIDLNGQTVSGGIYVFASPESSISQADFYIDDPTFSGSPYSTEGLAPYDLAGTASSGAAVTFDTTQLSNGSHSLSMRVQDTSGQLYEVQASFTVENSTSTQLSELIIDDAEASYTSYTNSWKSSTGTPAYLGGSVYNDSNSFFRWHVANRTSGTYDVYVWFTYHSNRSNAVPYRIYHANGVATKYVNQHDQNLAGKWHYLGRYDITGSSYVEISSENGQANADAVAMVLATGTVEPAPTVITLDNTSSSTSKTGTWLKSTGKDPYGADSVYSDSGSTFRWTPNIPEAGTYKVYAYWTQHPNRSKRVPYTIGHSSGSSTVLVDQSDKNLASQFVLLGTYTFSAGSGGYVQVSSSNGQACADAVRFEKID